MANGNPLASIVVINFNYARYLGTAIGSALGQTYRRREVVVVDDGSTDDSRAIIAGLGNCIRPVLQANAGQTAACNAGFAASAGDIVLFLDADDELHPRAIEEVVATWRPGLAKVQFCLELMGADGRAKPFTFPYFGADAAPRRLKAQVLRTGLYLWPPTSGNAFARAFLDRVLPLSTEHFPCMTDGALNTVAPLYGDVISIDKVLGRYRVHEASMQSAPLAERIRRGVMNKRREAEYLRAHAGAMNVALPADLLDQMIHLEGRLASLKLDRERHPVAGDTVRRLIGPALLKALRQDERAARRVFHMLWLLALAAAPRPLAERLVAFRFVPGTRSEFVTRAMAGLRLMRRPSGGTAPTLADIGRT